MPAGAVVVHNATELTTALAGSNLEIVLADGVYNRTTPFTNSGGYHLYAEHVGAATLGAGMIVGSNSGRTGAILRGLTFDVTDSARTLGGGEVHVWGSGGANTQILDCTFRGGWTVPYGLLAFNVSGLSLQRSRFYSFTDVAARLSSNSSVPYGGSTDIIDSIQDVLIDGVTRSVPGASNGTAEAGLWIGHPVRNGVHRIAVRNVSWSGIETVNNSWDTTFTDLDIDMGGAKQSAGVAVYMEHYTRNVTFENFAIKGAKVGFAGEWADPASGGVAGAHHVVIRNGVIDSAGTTVGGHQAGVYLDEGTEATTVTGVTFRNQNWAGIGAYRTAGTNDFTGNTFLMAPGAVQVSLNHL